MHATTPTASSTMNLIPGGKFLMGSDVHYPEERPLRRARVSAFFMDTYLVSNAELRRFVEETGYVTVAERPLEPEAYPDAEAYATWARKLLPSEAEWEFAARGGLRSATFTWGDEHAPNGKVMANTWHGEFPWQNLKANCHEGTSPVGAFPANGFGVHDMAGNVWEWTTDWFSTTHDEENEKPCCASSIARREPAREESFDPLQTEVRIGRKVIKGGSHLCAMNYCFRSRPAARSPQMIESSACHLGFRCIVQI